MSKQVKAEAYYHMLNGIADEHELDFNLAPGPKWQAINGILRMPNLNATEMAVMACLIDYAHEEHGFAFPSRKSIQLWTGRHKSAVDRALSKLEQLGLIERKERRLSYTKSETNLYIVNWEPFFAAYRRVEAHKTSRAVTRDGVLPENASGCSSKSGQVLRENGEQNSLTNLSYGKLSRSPYGDPLKGFSESLFFHGETQASSERVESQQGHSEECRVTLTSEGLTAAERLSRRYGVIFWTDALKGSETELKRCTLPKRRKELEDKIADCRKRIMELQHEQRDETATGTS